MLEGFEVKNSNEEGFNTDWNTYNPIQEEIESLFLDPSMATAYLSSQLFSQPPVQTVTLAQVENLAAPTLPQDEEVLASGDLDNPPAIKIKAEKKSDDEVPLTLEPLVPVKREEVSAETKTSERKRKVKQEADPDFNGEEVGSESPDSTHSHSDFKKKKIGPKGKVAQRKYSKAPKTEQALRAFLEKTEADVLAVKSNQDIEQKAKRLELNRLSALVSRIHKNLEKFEVVNALQAANAKVALLEGQNRKLHLENSALKLENFELKDYVESLEARMKDPVPLSQSLEIDLRTSDKSLHVLYTTSSPTKPKAQSSQGRATTERKYLGMSK